MPFFQADDQLAVNSKIRHLIEGSMTGDLAGLAGLGVWVLAGTSSQASLTDGVLTRVDLTRILLNPALVDDLATRLVAAGLWHGPGHTCDRCPPVAPDTWLFHDWFQFGYDTGEQVKATRARRSELKNTNVTHAVWARDCLDPADPNTAACRYCGVTTNRFDRKGPDRPAPQLDHVDPAKAKGVRNLVVACRTCNQKKGQRTPAQAGMRLRPPPRPTREDPTVLLADPTEQRPTDAVHAPADVRPDAQEIEPGHSPQARTSRSDPAPAQAATVSVGTAPTGQQQDRGGPGPNQINDQTDTGSDSGGLVRARDRARARPGLGQGTGQGHRQGSGEGQPPAAPAGRRRGRRGRRSAGAPAGPPQGTPATAAGPTWDAGEAPAGQGPGRFGSPYYGWRGAPPDAQTVEESTCAEHGLPAPCRKCVPDWVRDEGWSV